MPWKREGKEIKKLDDGGKWVKWRTFKSELAARRMIKRLYAHKEGEDK